MTSNSLPPESPEKPTTNDTCGKDSQELLGGKCEFKAYHKTIKGGVPNAEVISDPFAKFGARDDDSSYALVIKRTFQENKPKKTTLAINSPHILQAFRDAIVSYPPVPTDFKSPLKLKAPFQMLSHYWDELEEYRRLVAIPTARKHLDLLFDFMEHEVKPDRDRALQMIAKGQIDFEHAWVMYRPGEIMYMEKMGEPWLAVCSQAAYDEHRLSGPYLEVRCTYTDHNGTIAGDATHVVTMNQRQNFPAETTVAITDLGVYPRRHVKVDDSLERRLRLRGERFLALRDRHTMTYGGNGSAEWLKEPPFDFYDSCLTKFQGVFLPYTETGRIVLDRKTFGEENRMAKAQVKLAEPRPWLCPPFTVGYSLSRKQWGRFLVDNMTEVAWNPKAWDPLVLPDKEKLLLRSLITSHQYSENPRDHMQQKGKGLVVLLHGTPGSGKTLTAETAAEGCKKALISTSVGELNRGGNMITGSASFEKELKKMLLYATTWQAIVLLDEADVFLEARKENSTDRNALVAVFLKELEYFSGIVFLTTNRVASFDTAMKSRIHLSLGYRPPELEVRRRIWLKCLGAVPAGETVIDAGEAVDAPAFAPILEAPLNGREIANAVTTARTMARFEGAKLGLPHLETVLEVRRAFDESLKSGGLPE
ncbi:P-loop containing nucleoside triphosphate hydrolase protein [Xylariomycetidae sp. FL2044]|nr:P-loop containing nucleoside triphosphate hydrolase protein [Xylariomycetidae sp. FL2044]